MQSCFLVRMLYKDIYWLFRSISTNHLSFYIHITVTLYTMRFVKALLKFYWLIDWFGGPYQRTVRRGPFLIRVARIFSGGALFPKKVDDLFSRRYVKAYTEHSNVKNSVVKIWQLTGGPLAARAPSHDTTDTMVNPALCRSLTRRWSMHCTIVFIGSILIVSCQVKCGWPQLAYRP